MQDPVLVERRGFRSESGGAGERRGGLGPGARLPNTLPGTWNPSRPGGLGAAPRHLRGGTPRGGADVLRGPKGGNDFQAADAVMRPGAAETRAVVHTVGAGGRGDRFERDPRRVLGGGGERAVAVEPGAA